jgi:amino acid transporter
MCILVCLATLFSGFSGVTVASRIGYSMCRDHAFPYSDYLVAIDPVTQAPKRIIILLFIVVSSLCLLPLASTTAFTAIIQITTITTQISYGIPIYLRLTHSRDKFKQNAGFNLGRWSKPLGWIAIVWLSFTTIMCIFPTEIDPEEGITLHNFNYAPVITGLIIGFALVFWNLPEPYGAKYFFKGPKISEEEMHIVKRQ